VKNGEIVPPEQISVYKQQRAPTELYAIAAGLVAAVAVGGVILYLALTPPPSTAPPPAPAPTPTPTPTPAPTPTPTVQQGTSLTVSILPASPTEDDRITVSGSLTTSSGQPISNALIYITLDGVFLATPKTGVDGSYSYVFGPEASGQHILKVSYPGNSTYAPSSNSITFNVSPVTTVSPPPPSPAPPPSAPSISSLSITAGPNYVGMNRAYGGTVNFTVTTTPAVQGVTVAIYVYPASNPSKLGLVALLPTDSTGTVKTGFSLPAFNITSPGQYNAYALVGNVKSNTASFNVVSGFDVSSLDICSPEIAEGDYAYVSNQSDTNYTGYFQITNYSDYIGAIRSSPSPCGVSTSTYIQHHPYQPWYTFVGSKPPANAAPPGTQP
jgi:hypothetical protein